MTDRSRYRTDSSPWYRQFWPWFLIALPLSSVIAGVTTAVIAFDGADSLVRTDWYAEGRDINETIARDREAARRGIEVALEMTAIDGLIVARLTDPSGAPLPDALELMLDHPTHADRDRAVRLRPTGAGVFEAHVDLGAPGVWHVSLAPHGNEWRVTKRAGLPSAHPVVIESRS